MISSARIRLIFTFLIIATASAACAASESITRSAAKEERGQSIAIQRGILSNPLILESSGIASSRGTPGVFWTHNDSGGLAQIFALNASGEDLGVFTIRGLDPIDWEDMGSFQDKGKSMLFIADTGDNRLQRTSYSIYFVEEPAVDGKLRGVKKTLEVLKTIEFVYEDGRHDCEAAAIDPGTGNLYLVSKILGLVCGVYELRVPEDRPAQPLIARKIAKLRLLPVTALDIAQDGSRAVVLTYGDAYEFLRQPTQSWAEAFSTTPRLIKMPVRKQGEAVCYGPDNKTLYATSEGKSSPLWEIPAGD